MKRTFAVGTVYADGVPQTHFRDLTALQALDISTRMRKELGPRVPPLVIVWDDDDPERGYFDADRLIEVARVRAGHRGRT